jgi:hypothetical protein
LGIAHVEILSAIGINQSEFTGNLHVADELSRKTAAKRVALNPDAGLSFTANANSGRTIAVRPGSGVGIPDHAELVSLSINPRVLMKDRILAPERPGSNTLLRWRVGPNYPSGVYTYTDTEHTCVPATKAADPNATACVFDSKSVGKIIIHDLFTRKVKITRRSGKSVDCSFHLDCLF